METLSAYKPTREAWSICSAALFLLYKIENDIDLLKQSVEAAIQAHQVDPTWPWPFLQLANILQSDNHDREIVQQSFLKMPGLGLEDVLPAESLRKRAVELAIDNTEFKRQVLGGRTRVFVLGDPHRLLSSSIVLKPTTLEQAHTEMTAVSAFQKHITEYGREAEYILPTPILVRSVSADKCIYAMERAEGQTLGDGLLELVAAGQQTEVINHLERAASFLALYHAWRLMNVQGAPKFSNVRREVTDTATIIGLDADHVERIVQLAKQFLPSSIPLLPKKDAHPENWLMIASGLVMLDLESTGSRPACYEVAQLLDDYGVLPASHDGMQARLTITQSYISSMGKFGAPILIDPDALEHIYAFFWALRSGFGLGYCRRHSGVQSSTAQKRLAERQRHYMASLQFLRVKFRETPMEAIASLIQSSCEDFPKSA